MTTILDSLAALGLPLFILICVAAYFLASAVVAVPLGWLLRRCSR